MSVRPSADRVGITSVRGSAASLHLAARWVAGFLVSVLFPLIAATPVLAQPRPSSAAVQPVVCPDGQPADGIYRLGNNQHCLVAVRIEPAKVRTRTLVVFLHGDIGGRIDLADPNGAGAAPAALALQLGVVTFALQRPGYESNAGRSDSDRKGAGGKRGDDYTPDNLRIVADALQHLRRLNPDRKLLLVGYDGGAATAALLANRFPASADAYLLAACPCDVPAWRQSRIAFEGPAASPWTRSLSPLGETAGVPPAALMHVLVGARDENTWPRFSEAYVAALQKRGVKTRVTYAAGATHVSVLRAPEFFMLAGDLAGRLSR
ncbi:MAG: hypothetical protein Q7T87_10555 [Polaromonas sp.]|nr:hypothetical protein [Polaromonas sp.]